MAPWGPVGTVTGWVVASGGFVTQIQSTLSTPVTESHLFLPSRLHPWGGHWWAPTAQSLVAPAGQQDRRVNSSDWVIDLLVMLPVPRDQPKPGHLHKSPANPPQPRRPVPRAPSFMQLFSQASMWPPSFPAKEGIRQDRSHDRAPALLLAEPVL